MRQFLFVLFLLASLPAAAKAAPYAEYDPRTGDVIFRELRGNGFLNILSRSGSLRTSILSEVPIISPLDATPPLVINGSSTSDSRWGIAWTMEGWVPATTTPFIFDSIEYPAAVPAGTQVEDLSIYYGIGRGPFSQMSLRVVPEPSSLLAGMAGAAILLHRRRFGGRLSRKSH